MAAAGISRRSFVATAASKAVAGPFINLANYRLFAGSMSWHSDRAIPGENFRRVLGDIRMS